jgi:diguanylate cyclase (GGDEF)-like protein/putative nucleotidyltransferase with HDIG domain
VLVEQLGHAPVDGGQAVLQRVTGASRYYTAIESEQPPGLAARAGDHSIPGACEAGVDPEDDHPCGILRGPPDAFARLLAGRKFSPQAADIAKCMLGRREREQDQQLEELLSQARSRIHELEAELRARSESDPITGLGTLDRVRNQLDIEAARARRHSRPLTVAVLDVDGFRAICAKHGHAAGDEVLRTVADVLIAETRVHDISCRGAGDEFVVLMPETEVEGAVACCERMLDTLEATPSGPIQSVSLSGGIAAYDRADSPGAALGAAYVALDHARKLGGHRVTTGEQPTDVTPEESDRRDAVSALAVTLGERDRYTGDHSEEVLKLVVGVATGLGLDDDEVDRVRAAALLHDIGKVAISDDILNKPAKLTPEEWKLMKDHTVIGERILRAIPGLGSVARIVRHEHERWDGGGYPDGIAGDAIPIGSRIILACDAYHAMTSDRPYRDAMTHAQAVAELSRHAGTQFDPQVVEVLIGQLYLTRQGGAAASAA